MITYVLRDRENGTVVQTFLEEWAAKEKLRQMQRLAGDRFGIEREFDKRSRRSSLRTKAAWALVARHRQEYQGILAELEAGPWA